MLLQWTLMFTDKMEMTKPLSTTITYNQLDEPAIIMYTFHIGDSRNVYIDEDDDVTMRMRRVENVHFCCSTMGSICSRNTQY